MTTKQLEQESNQNSVFLLNAMIEKHDRNMAIETYHNVTITFLPHLPYVQYRMEKFSRNKNEGQVFVPNDYLHNINQKKFEYFYSPSPDL